jgi:hypothetical protein
MATYVCKDISDIKLTKFVQNRQLNLWTRSCVLLKGECGMLKMSKSAEKVEFIRSIWQSPP